jgi:hypothetical protein
MICLNMTGPSLSMEGACLSNFAVGIDALLDAFKHCGAVDGGPSLGMSAGGSTLMS